MRGMLLAIATLALALPAQAQQVTARTAPAQPTQQATPDAPPQQGFDRFARARDNLAALRDGRRSIGELTPQELQDVIDLDARARGSYPDTRPTRQRCVDNEVRRLGGRPSQLDWQVIRLKCRD